MGIFEFFKFKDASAPANLSAITPKRFHARYKLNSPDLCFLEHARYGLFSVVDISYHGCLVEAIGDASFDNCTYPGLLELSLGGSNLRLEASQSQRRKKGWGIIFKHSGESSIRSLGTFVEALRYGDSAISLANSPGRDGAVSRFRRRYQGDGPFDLLVEVNEAGKLIFIMVSVRRFNEYGCIIWDNGNLITKKTIDSVGVGARMAQTHEVDLGLVEVSILSCIGLKFPDGALCAAILCDWVKTHSEIPLAKSS
jgi:hypothetical protein